MEAISCNRQTVTNEQTEQEQLILKAQEKFLEQVYEGKDAEEAFKKALSVVNEKYCPETDSYTKEDDKEKQLYERDVFGAFRKFKINGKILMRYLNYIAEILPTVIDLINRFPKAETESEQNNNYCA